MPEPSMRLVDERYHRVIEEAEALSQGGGGGTSDGMEPRVKRLEDNFDRMGRYVADLRVQMATLTERVAHLPSKGFIVTTIGTGLSLIAAVVVFADKLRAAITG